MNKVQGVGTMDTARYKAFLAAVETGSFAAAAKQLDYTVSGVSQLVAALEKEVGFPLLLRSRHGVTLSPNGERLLVPIRQLLREEERVEELASDIRGLLTGSLNIAAYSSVATHWLPKVIGRFQRDYPQIKIHLREGIRQEVMAWLDDGTADIGFLSYQEPMPYDWIPLSDDEMVAAVPPDHELAPNGPYPLSRCQEETVIMPALGKDDDVLHLSPASYRLYDAGECSCYFDGRRRTRHLYHEPPHYPETGDVSRHPAPRSAVINYPRHRLSSRQCRLSGGSKVRPLRDKNYKTSTRS